MRRTFPVAVMAAAVLSTTGITASAEETPSPSPAATSTQLERVSAYTQPSVVYVGIEWTGYVYDRYNKMYLNNEKPFRLQFQCTGYVVNPDGYIATAGHCVDHEEVLPQFRQVAAEWALETGYYESTTLTLEDILGFDDYQVVNDENKKRPDLKVTTAWSVSAGGVETGKALPARVVKWQKFDQGDGALLKVEAEDLNALPLAEEEIDIGTEVVAVGYPGSVDLVADQTFTPSYKEGAVSSTKTVSNGLLRVYEISAAVSGGMSGGPTVNLEGEVVGFNSFGINSQIETQAFNFVRPVETVKELLGDAGTSEELSEDGQAYRDGLDAYFAGDKATAVAKLGSVVENQPTHELAKEYLDKAKELPNPPKAEEGGGLGVAIGIGLVLLLLVLGVVGLMLMRRNKRGAVAHTPVQEYAGVAPSGGPAQLHDDSSPAPSFEATAPSAPRFEPSAPIATSAANGAPGPSLASGSAPAATAEIVDDTMFCSGCGTKGEPGQRFCKHCGTAL